MRTAIHIRDHPALAHQRSWGNAMIAGLKKHGLEVVEAPYNSPIPCDFAVMWGYKQPQVIKQAPHVLIMERGHIGLDWIRYEYTSLGWDGLAGRGRYPKADDCGERWKKNFSHLLKPWRDDEVGYVLVIGQVEGDTALNGINFTLWKNEIIRELTYSGYRVKYRSHPLVEKTVPLEKDLADAKLCITYNSTTGVDSVLSGVPTIAMDIGSMAWDVASHDFGNPIIRPDRTQWMHDLAWKMWTFEEIESGEPFEYLRPIIND